MAQKQARSSTITTGQAASLLMVSDQWVRSLRKQGWFEEASRGRYNLVDVVQGYIRFLRDENRRASKSEAAKKATDARAREIELRIAERERKLIPFEEADAAMADFAGVVLAEISSLPSRMTRDRELRRAMEKEVSDALGRINEKLSVSQTAIRTGDLDANP